MIGPTPLRRWRRDFPAQLADLSLEQLARASMGLIDSTHRPVLVAAARLTDVCDHDRMTQLGAEADEDRVQSELQSNAAESD